MLEMHMYTFTQRKAIHLSAPKAIPALDSYKLRCADKEKSPRIAAGG